MKNITKKTQTILFAGLIAAMILPFSTTGLAEAEPIDPKTVEKLAINANEITEKLKTETDPKKIVKLQNKLDNLTAKLNSYGLYNDVQFKKVKADIEKERPGIEEEIGAALACACNPEAWYRVGFDYKKWGWNGSTPGNWVVLKTINQHGFSEASTASWGADWMHVWNGGFVKYGSTSTINIGTMIQASNGGVVHNYGAALETFTAAGNQIYVSSLPYSPINGGDKAVSSGTLKSLS